MRTDQRNYVYTEEEMGHRHHQTVELTESLDHDYEGLDIYTEITQQENRVIQPSNHPARLPNTHDYNITQCQAYGAFGYK